MRHYLHRFSRLLGREVNEISAEAFAQLRAYSWPGNIRELQSVLKQALLHASGTVLLPAFLPRLAGPDAPSALDEGLDLAAFIRPLLSPEMKNLYAETHDQVDRLLFTMTLGYTRGNQRDAARLLGISRQTMRVKMRALGIQVTHSVEANDDEPAAGSIPPAQPSHDSD